MITRPKIKCKMTKHAKQRLFERFGLTALGKVYQNQTIPLDSFSLNKKAFFIVDRGIVAIRNKNSKNLITFLTPEMWNENEFNMCWKESMR